ncbi:MAG: BlaI/MecI/CopY family transcriptional regulator [Clostridia bacterium]|nr:BlaI/MecI/CopY family transcriptional regulator [Clostridia bacterium]
MRLTDAEWSVLEALWTNDRLSLGEIYDILKIKNGWSKTTVHTYLKRMAAKSLVGIDNDSQKPYCALISRENCAVQERRDLLERVYNGAAGDMIAAFLKDSKISSKEVERLKKLLDDMEV